MDDEDSDSDYATPAAPSNPKNRTTKTPHAFIADGLDAFTHRMSSQNFITNHLGLGALTHPKQLAIQEDVVFSVDDAYSDLPRHQWGRHFVLKQDHTATTVWNVLLLTSLVYVGTVFIYRFTFVSFHLGPNGITPLDQDDENWKVINYIVDCFFWVDLVLNFFLSYENAAGCEVTDMRLIAKRYLLGMFWLNLLACLPEQVFSVIIQSIFQPQEGDFWKRTSIARIYRLQRLSRLARLARLARFAQFNSWDFISGWKWFSNARGIRILEFMLGLTFTCHVLACGWYLTAVLQENVSVTWVAQWTIYRDGETLTLLSEDPYQQWVVSMYFILTVFTTVGFGDISANTETEIAFVVFTMIVGAVVHSIIISEVINLVTTRGKAHEFIEHQMCLLAAFANHTDFDQALYRDIQKDLRERSKRSVQRATFDKDEMEQLLMSKYMPRSIIGRLKDGLFHGKLCKNSFLQCCYDVAVVPPRLSSLLAIHLQPVEYYSGELAYQMHDFAFNLGLVLHGTFAYIGEPTPSGGRDGMPCNRHDGDDGQQLSSRSMVNMFKSGLEVRRSASLDCTAAELQRHRLQSRHLHPYLLVGHGSYFGDHECFSGTVRLNTVRCERAGTALLLRKQDLIDLMQKFPQFGSVWATVAWKRENRRLKAKSRLIEAQGFRTFAATMMQQFYVSWRNAQPVRNDPSEKFAEIATRETLQNIFQHALEPNASDTGVQDEQSSNADHADYKEDGGKLLGGNTTRNSHRVSRSEMMSMTSTFHAHAVLSRDVQELRCTVKNMHNEYRSDMQECRRDLSEMKEILNQLLCGRAYV